MQGREKLRELAAQIATEQDHDRFTGLIKEFNQILDGAQQKSSDEATDAGKNK